MHVAVVSRLQLVPDLTTENQISDSVSICSAANCRNPESMYTGDAEEHVSRVSCRGNYQSCLREKEHWLPS